VGQQVKALEARLGVRLFERLHKQLILTAAGQAYLPGVSDGFRRIADATSQLKPAGAVLLQVGIHGGFDLRRLALAEFRSMHAEIGLRGAAARRLARLKAPLIVPRSSASANGSADARFSARRRTDALLWPAREL
jgi:LysR family glycine cleavage system transcriptional activator